MFYPLCILLIRTTRQNATANQQEDCEDVIISIVHAALVDDEAKPMSDQLPPGPSMSYKNNSAQKQSTKLSRLCWKHCDNMEKAPEIALKALTEVMNVHFQFFFFEIGCILNCLGSSFHCFPCFNFDIDCNSNDSLQCSCSCIARDGRWKCVEPTTDCYFEFIGEGDGR